MKRYRLSNEAKNDIIEICKYGLEQFGFNQAGKYFEELFDKFEEVAKDPKIYQEVNHIKEGYLHCIHKSNTIYFKVENDIPHIMAIVGSQNRDTKL